MKKLIFICMLALAACSCSGPDHKAVVVLNHLKYPSDTVTINYYGVLRLQSSSEDEKMLTDASGNDFGSCSSFSILSEESIIVQDPNTKSGVVEGDNVDASTEEEEKKEEER